jgi:hypothetical protein
MDYEVRSTPAIRSTSSAEQVEYVTETAILLGMGLASMESKFHLPQILGFSQKSLIFPYQN